jgi:hypothetical protein
MCVRDRKPLDDEVLGSLEELHNSLVNRLLHYQHVLEEHRIPLPYGSPMVDTDLIKLVADESP